MKIILLGIALYCVAFIALMFASRIGHDPIDD